MREIIVIQCSRSKNPLKESWKYNNQEVRFIANPSECGKSASILYCKPDDTIPYSNITWRQKLEEYNRDNGNPPGFLYKAWALYKPSIYKQLVDNGVKDVFILSAGWGLVRSDYLLPNYNITFAQQAEACNKRSKNDVYNDYNQLKNERMEKSDTIY